MNNSNVKVMSSMALVALMATVIFPVVTNAASTLNDPEFDLALAWGYDTGLTKYNTQDAFRPFGTLRRDEASKFLSEFASEILGIEADANASCTFADISSADPSLVSSIALACGQGILKGSNGSFLPAESMTKAQFVTALVRALHGNVLDESTSPWWKNYYDWAYTNEITKEASALSLDKPITRYEALLMLYRGATTDEVDPTDPDTETPVVASGEYSVSKSASSAKGSIVPKGASISVASFDVKADKAGKLSSITLERVGLGSKTAVDNVALYINGELVSKSRPFQSDDTREFTLTPALTLKAGETVTIEAVAKISTGSDANNTEFAVAATAVNGKSFRAIEGNTFKVATVMAVELEVTDNGSDDTVRLGEKDVVVAEFDVSHDDNNYPVSVSSITLKDVKNNARTNLENFRLKFDGKIIATVASIDGRYLTFNLSSPIVIDDSTTETIEVLADVVAGVGDDVQFVIDDSKYIIATDGRYGYGVAVVNGNTFDGAKITIDAGEVSIERVALTNTKMRADKDDYVVAAFDLTVNAGSEAELQSIKFDTTNSSSDLGDIFDELKLFVNGTREDGDIVAGSVSFDDLVLSIPTGKKVRVELRGDTKKAITSGEVTFVLNNGAITLEDVLEGDKITDITPSSLSFQKLTVSTSDASVTQIAAKDLDVVAGTTNIAFVEFQVETNEISSVKFRELTVENISGFNKDLVTKVTLQQATANGWTDVATYNGTKISSTLKLDGFSVEIPATATVKFRVAIDVTSNSDLQGTIEARIQANSVKLRDDKNATLNVTHGAFNSVVVTIVGEGELSVSTDTSAIANDAYIVAGATSANVAAFKVKATDEAILVKDLTVTFSGITNISDVVSHVQLVDGAGKVLNPSWGYPVNNSNVVSINNVNYEIAKDATANISVRLVTKKSGKAGTASSYFTDDFQVKLEVARYEGITSNKETTTATGSISNRVASIVPVKLGSLALSAYDASAKLGDPNQTIAKIEIAADAWTNSKEDSAETAELELNKLVLDAAANGFSGAVNFVLRGNNSSVTGTLTAGKIEFDLSTMVDADRLFNPSQSKTFYVELDNASFGANASVSVSYDQAKNSTVEYSEKEETTVIDGLRTSSTRFGTASVNNY